MTDHANELRRYARKIAHPAGDVPSVMLAAANEIERLAARLEAAEKERDNANAAAAGVALHAGAMQDRLEAAEADALEQSRLNGMGSEREAALMAKLEAAEKERDECNRRRLEAADHFAAQTALMKEQLEALRTKITEREKQEPVGWIYTVNGGWDCYSPMKPTEDVYDTGSLMPLYALPGAKGE